MARNEKNDREYRCVWGRGYVKPCEEIHGLNWFMDSERFTDKECRAVSRLKVGDCWSDCDKFAEFLVFRIS